MLHILHEFLVGAFLGDVELFVGNFNLQIARSKGATEDDLLGILGNIDETTGSGHSYAELADIDIADAVALGQA